MTKERILIVEDDNNISRLIKYNLDKAGYSCAAVATGEDSLTALRKEKFSLVVLDIMLPKMDGFEVCRTMKKDAALSSIPIIILTAKGEEVDRVVGFELGADDYVVKPFSPRELTLRVKAVMKRHQHQAKETVTDLLKAGNLIIDIPRHKVTLGNEEISLTLLEFKLLQTLIQRKGRVQSRDKLLNDVWDIASEVTTRTIDTHIKRLRQKLLDMGEMIETVRGVGYRFSDEKVK